MELLPEKVISSSLVGRKLATDRFEVTIEHIEDFAQATDDDNAHYFANQKGDTIAPPMFGVCLANRVLREAMAATAFPLPLDRSVHGEQRMYFYAPICPWDVLISEGTITSVKEHSTGSTVTFEVESRTLEGSPRIRQISTVFIRTKITTRARRRFSKAPPKPLHTVSINVPKNQALRYAEASFTEGIRVHEEHDYARTLGYETNFLAGQNTLAFAAKAIVDNVAKRDPTRLTYLETRFTQVVYPLDTLTTRIWTESNENICFDTTKQDATAVLTNGIARVRN